MRKIILSLLATLLAMPADAADRYEFDKSHTAILFFVSHLGFSNTVGKFTDFDGYFTFDEQKPETSTINVTIKPTGVRTSSDKLDEHLQNKDFFHTEQFPEVKFVSTSVKITGKNTGEITGDLTLLGVTKPVVLNVAFNKAGEHPMTKDQLAGFSATATIKRSEFGMNYGLGMVGDEVKLIIETEGVNMNAKKRSEKKAG
jgi:polyisoprenoid-binding protein YceI